MPKEFTRRLFLGGAALAATSCQPTSEGRAGGERSGGPLPKRPLGRTGETPSILALGCGSRLQMYGDEERGIEAVTLALDLGITYLDTAQSYNRGTSETWVGQALQGRRDNVFVASKISVRDYDEALRETERSLERLRTDRIDLLHIHSLKDADDLAAVEAGSLRALRELRDQGVCRFIGVTSHTDPSVLATALERHDFDCTQMALNAAKQGRSANAQEQVDTAAEDSFEHIALPVAIRKNMGVLAMKVTGQEHLVGDGLGQAGIQPLLEYALSLPISAAVVGMPTLDHLRENIQIARGFQPMPADRMQEFSRELAAANKVAMDRHFCLHEDV